MDRISRSPSPNPAGWSTPIVSRSSTPSAYAAANGHGHHHEVTWASAQARSAQINNSNSHGKDKHPLHLHAGAGADWRTITVGGALSVVGRRVAGLFPGSSKERGKRSRGGMMSGLLYGNRPGRLSRGIRALARWIGAIRVRTVVLVVVCFLLWLFLHIPIRYRWRRTSWLGGGKKYVVILAANQGGGVMEWKGPREWAIERDSVRNKKKYATRWGYELEIVDMSTKKRYAHEWRESWEKVDTIRNAMRKYPQAEWFWWLDLNTFIMEPGYSLQSHIFKHLERHTYRDINTYNPLNVTHPPREEYLDEETRSPNGDGKPSSIDIIITQDCGGFNLGSFMVRRSVWTDRLLDIWWDPVGYEQKHMEWEHKEQDALESLYINQPWVRTHLAFINQRAINSFPAGACGEKGDNLQFHYQRADRDFVVNMAGCEWGRDCWGEMYNFRELSNFLNRTWWEKFKEGSAWGIIEIWKMVKSLFVKKPPPPPAPQQEGSG